MSQSITHILQIQQSLLVCHELSSAAPCFFPTGAGVATHLTILLHHEKCIPANHNIRCFAFAPPPTFHPLEAAPEAVQSTMAYSHGDDTVPFLSVYHLRRIFKSMARLDQACRDMRLLDFFRIDWGYEDPSEAMV